MKNNNFFYMPTSYFNPSRVQKIKKKIASYTKKDVHFLKTQSKLVEKQL